MWKRSQQRLYNWCKIVMKGMAYNKKSPYYVACSEIMDEYKTLKEMNE